MAAFLLCALILIRRPGSYMHCFFGRLLLIMGQVRHSRRYIQSHKCTLIQLNGVKRNELTYVSIRRLFCIRHDVIDLVINPDNPPRSQ